VTKRVRALSPRWEALRDEQEAAVAAAIVAIVAADPAELNVAAIAERAGISRQTFYKRYPTLALAVVAAHRRFLFELPVRLERVLASRAPAADGLDRLLTIFDALFEVYTSDLDMLRFTTYYDFTFRVHRMSAEEREEHPLAPKVEGEDNAPMVELFEAGQRDGSIDPDLAPRATVRAMSTSMLGVVQRLQIQDDWTTGTDEAARETYAVMMDVWKRRLTGHAATS
jgi:AcrR family transcriptional regulator